MVSPREMSNCTLATAMSKQYKYVYAYTVRGWERITRVTPWGADLWAHIDTHKHGGFCEGHKYVVYRPNAAQRKLIDMEVSQ